MIATHFSHFSLNAGIPNKKGSCHCFSKETLEVFGDGRVIRMENFRVTTGHRFKGFRSFRTWRQDKGHRAEIAAFVAAVAAGGPAPIPFEQIVNVTKASFAALESVRSGIIVKINNDIRV